MAAVLSRRSFRVGGAICSLFSHLTESISKKSKLVNGVHCLSNLPLQLEHLISLGSTSKPLSSPMKSSSPNPVSCDSLLCLINWIASSMVISGLHSLLHKCPCILLKVLITAISVIISLKPDVSTRSTA